MHEAMKPALKNTYGVIVYQEQVMQISKDMCGFTDNTLHCEKPLVKKSGDSCENEGRLYRGWSENCRSHTGDDGYFWRQLEDFAAYCFNKSHAACYGLIAYQTAYIKAHYPAALMAALMTDDYDDTDRLTIDITECKRIEWKSSRQTSTSLSTSLV